MTDPRATMIWRALDLLAIDPGGLGGLGLTARASPLRDHVLRGWAGADLRRIPPGIADTQLFGGIDLAATLGGGTLVQSRGLLDQPGTFILPMAERCTPGLAARLAQMLDRGAGHAVIALNEAASEDEGPPPALADRLGLALDLDGLRLADLGPRPDVDIPAAGARLPDITVPEDQTIAMATVAARFGIASLRAPIFALAAARANAALRGASVTEAQDLEVAAQLVLAPRATMLPEDTQPETDSAPEPEPDPADSGQNRDTSDQIPDDILTDAIAAILPPDVLAALVAGTRSRGAKGAGGAGEARRGNRRGRPLPARPGTPRDGQRIDLVATLRAAAPWQTIRRRAAPDRTGVIIHRSDLHIRQFEEKSDRLVIFAVDASGSSAMARLAEAKGAIEIMLAEAYARRDHVALVVFRGDGAEVALPPTRSLVLTKRRLAGLPGGGGTPLAAGLQAAQDLARRARGQGLSPALALLTDGRANVALPGRIGRSAAVEDAEAMARVWAALDLPGVVIDTALRPQDGLRQLAQVLRAAYVPLPRADARAVSTAIGAALEP